MHSNKTLGINQMKLLYLGAFGSHCSDPFRVSGIEQSGLYELMYLDYRKEKDAKGHLFKEYIMDWIKKFKPHVVLMNKAERITVEDLLYWKSNSPETIFVLWYGDMRNSIESFVASKLPHLDGFMTNTIDEDYIRKLGHYGISKKKVFYSHTATDLTIFRKYPEIKETYDIMFFGGNYGNKFDDSIIRTRMIKKLVAEYKDVWKIKIHGKGWMDIDCEVNPVVYKSDFAKAASSTKIILGFSSFLNRDHYTSNRIWNSMACGFHLTHKFNGINKMFRNKEHLVWFSSYGEMVEMIGHYLNNSVERRKIHDIGRAEISASHTYLRRASEMYPIFKQLLQVKYAQT